MHDGATVSQALVSSKLNIVIVVCSMGLLRLLLAVLVVLAVILDTWSFHITSSSR